MASFGVAEEQGIFERDKLMKNMMRDAVALYLRKNNVLLHGEKSCLDQDRRVVPFEKDEEIMIPAAFFLESIKEKCSAAVTATENTAAEQETELFQLLTEKGIAVEAGPGGRLYAPVSELCRTYHQYLHIEKNGIIIYSPYDMEKDLDWVGNMKVMRHMCESYLFDDVDGDTLLAMLREKHPDKGHPRLILTPEKIQEMRREILSENGDEVYKKIFAYLKSYADIYMEERTSGYEIRDNIRLLYVCRENHDRMLACTLMYLITEEEKYAQRAYLEMYASACFVDWNPYHFLDVGEMALELGLCYDWLYHWMSPWQRKYIREAIVKNGIYAIMEDIQDKPRKRSWNWRGELADNWRMVITGVGVSALAVMDELEGEELEYAKTAAEQTLFDIRRALSLFAPLGAYEEGCNYWGYAMEYFAFYMKSLLTAVGSDFGYVDVPGMRLTNQYMMAVNGLVSTFNYHDCGEADSNLPPEMMFLAEYFGNYSEALPRIHSIMTEKEEASRVINDMLHYNPVFCKARTKEAPKDSCLPIAEIATMRSGWDAADLYLGFHCDDPIGGEGHDHMDSGTFVLDSQGERFFLDLGSDSYNIPNYRHCYRVRAEGHNTVIFNPEADYAHKYGGTAKIVAHQFAEEECFAVGELTDAYDKKHGVKSFQRTAGLDRNRTRAYIKDKVRLEKEADFWWFAHTRAKIEIVEGGKKAVLEQNGKKLLAVIESGEKAFLSVMDAKPLPTSPVIEEQDPNEGVRKLVIHIPECGDLDLTVLFTAYEG